MEWPREFRSWQDVSRALAEPRARLRSAGRRGVASLTGLIFPPVCLICGDTSPELADKICSDCAEKLCGETARRCPRCAKPLPQYSRGTLEGCPLCRTKRLRFTQAITLGTYGGQVRDVILRMKQVRHESLSLAVGELLGQKISHELDSPVDFVTPVPMHWLRKIVRGTNDSELLSAAVARELGVPLRCDALRCLRSTRKQGTLLPTQRKKNVRNAYGVRPRAPVADAHVLVVDDVLTTGATANELARVLLRAGARRVSIGVVARGVGF